MRLTSESVLHYTCIKSGENVDIFCDQCFDGKRFCRWFPFRFYNAICPFQASISSDDDVISREFASLRAHAPAGDSQSVDSGIDLQQSVRVSTASTDSDTGSRSSMLSQDSTVTCDVTAAALAAAVPVKVEVSADVSAEAAGTNVDDVKPTVDLASACSTDV